MKVQVKIDRISGNEGMSASFFYTFTMPNGYQGENSVKLFWFAYRNTLERVKGKIVKKLKRSVLAGMTFEVEI